MMGKSNQLTSTVPKFGASWSLKDLVFERSYNLELRINEFASSE